MLIKVRLCGSAWHGSQRCVRNEQKTKLFQMLMFSCVSLSKCFKVLITINMSCMKSSLCCVAADSASSGTAYVSCIEL